MACYFNPRTPCGVRHSGQIPKIDASINFNPRTPCGVRLNRLFPCRTFDQFQSTHPVRGATRCKSSSKSAFFDFNPRTPCGVRRLAFAGYVLFAVISIHAPRAGCDSPKHFRHNTSASISIHAPRAGCDVESAVNRWTFHYFNPRTPCGVRPLQYKMDVLRELFQSTHPVRGATAKENKYHV